MKYPLNRFFNIVNPVFLIVLAIAIGGTTAVCCIYAYSWKLILVLSAVVLSALMYYLIWIQPKVIEIKNDQISYRRQQVRRNVNGWTPALWVSYYVSDISYVALKQTRLERLFDVGHIEFRGNTHFEVKKEKYREKVFLPSLHLVYGIRNYSQVSREIAAQFPNVILP